MLQKKRIFTSETLDVVGLKSHPGHGIAKKQMKMFGGMIAFEVKGGTGTSKKSY